MKLKRDDLEKIAPNIVDVPHRKIMMCLNESPVNPFSHIWDKVAEKLGDLAVNRYHSQNTDDLLEKLADYCNVSPSQIAMGNGADEMIYYFFVMLRSRAEDKIIYPAPSYFDYKTYSKAVGLSQEPVDLLDDLSLDQNSFIQHLEDDNSVCAIICNPNNPTGNLISKEAIINIIESTEKPVLVDEAYFEFSKTTVIDLIEQYENLFVLRTFSKGFLSAGLRFGYIIAKQKSIYELRKVMTAFNLSLVIQSIALVYLENIDWFERQIESLIEGRDYLYSSLLSIDGIEPLPSSTNFITFRVADAKDELFDYLKQSEIAIRSVSTHRLLKDCLRVTIGTESENRLFISAVQSFFSR